MIYIAYIISHIPCLAMDSFYMYHGRVYLPWRRNDNYFLNSNHCDITCHIWNSWSPLQQDCIHASNDQNLIEWNWPLLSSYFLFPDFTPMCQASQHSWFWLNSRFVNGNTISDLTGVTFTNDPHLKLWLVYTHTQTNTHWELLSLKKMKSVK